MRKITKRGVEIAQQVYELRSKLMNDDLTLEETNSIMSKISDANIELSNLENK
tara:strand:+ start:746 stop:904 length:159 start_codon:yes stop_codon:yes gene_type:complete